MVDSRDTGSGIENNIVCFCEPEGINGFLSNLYKSNFVDGVYTYNSIEQYMAGQKAIIFSDIDTFEKVVVTDDPVASKRIGREVRGYRDDTWATFRKDIAKRALYEKFTQSKELLDKLLSFPHDCGFAKCSEYDKIWGTGVSLDSQYRTDKSHWTGSNLLGECIEEVRDKIIMEQSDGKFILEAYKYEDR